MERFCCWFDFKAYSFRSFHFFWFFHAFLPGAGKTPHLKKAWFDNDDDFIGWCVTFILCHVSLDKMECDFSFQYLNWDLEYVWHVLAHCSVYCIPSGHGSGNLVISGITIICIVCTDVIHNAVTEYRLSAFTA